MTVWHTIARMKYLPLCMILFAACGGSDDDGATVLEGNWISQLDAECALAFNATGSEYAIGTLCVEGSNRVLSETEVGTLSVTATTLTTTPKRASCPMDATVETLRYQLASNALTVSTDEVTIQFVRNPAGSTQSGATVVHGCFGESGFTPSPIRDL